MTVGLAMGLPQVGDAHADVHLLASGLHHPRVLSHLRSLERVTVHMLAPLHYVPRWAQHMYRATFIKLAMLNLSWHVRGRVLYIDNDVYTLRPASHLAHSTWHLVLNTYHLALDVITVSSGESLAASARARVHFLPSPPHWAEQRRVHPARSECARGGAGVA